MLNDQARGVDKAAKISIYTLLLALTILLLDQGSKFIVQKFIPLIDESYYVYPYGGIPVFKNFIGIEFSINHITNKGAAWGLFGGYQLILVLLRIVLIIWGIIYLFFYNQHRSWQIPILMILAGAIGNVIDFFMYGHVIDMFHVVLWGYDFPVFNIADSAITIGIGSLILLSWFESK